MQANSLSIAGDKAVEPEDANIKYLNARKFIPEALRDAEYCGVAPAPPSLSILDVGTGPGYFPLICGQMGHNCVAMDKSVTGFLADIRRSLGLKCIQHQIGPCRPFPKLAQRFDLVTIFRVPLNVVKRETRLFTLDEWTFMLDDIRDNLLNPGGVLAMKLHQFKKFPGLHYGSPELMKLFEKRGAKIGRAKFLLFSPLI